MTEPGWYVDPDDRELARWHDGFGWTPSWVRRVDWPGPEQPPPPAPTGAPTPRHQPTTAAAGSGAPTAPRPIVWGAADVPGSTPSSATARRRRVGGGLIVLTVVLVGLVVVTQGGSGGGSGGSTTTTTLSAARRAITVDPRFASVPAGTAITCPFTAGEVAAVVQTDLTPAASDGTLCQFRNDDVLRLVNIAFPATATVGDFRSTKQPAYAGCTDLTFETGAPKGTLLVHCTQEPFQGAQVNETLLVFDTENAPGAWVIVVASWSVPRVAYPTLDDWALELYSGRSQS